ncbi:TraR/DksA family transcriptional regulator [Amphritea sp.]|uniref:TraR/DksA family transcriptional regulator n=1 Tax=Amphritea sp. TaxID=1872502 RepID=UPI003A935022
MDDQPQAQCQAALQALKAELNEEIINLELSAQPVILDQQAVGRVSRGDALQQQNMALANLEQCRRRLHEVLHAELKFSEAEYGYCEGCDKLISLARLLARPDSRFCLDCQSAAEQTH